MCSRTACTCWPAAASSPTAARNWRRSWRRAATAGWSSRPHERARHAPFQADLDAVLAACPPAEHAARRAAFARFAAHGLPNRREEDWRYTDLTPLATRSFPPAPAASGAPPLADFGLPRRLFVNGTTPPGESAAQAHDPNEALPDSPLAALNFALARNGLDLDLTRDDGPAALHVVLACQAAQPAGIHQRHRIRLAPGAEATLVLQHIGNGEYLETQHFDIRLAEGARLRLIRLQEGSAASTQLAATHVHLARDARLDVWNVDLGNGLARHDLEIDLDAPGAEVQVHGLAALAGRSHVDTHLRIAHRAPHGTSRAVFRGVVADRAHAVLNGQVHVLPGASGTDSDLQIAHLLLSSHAEVNAKPELLIEHDDVRCAHGAATGQLDETALFYLRARGLPPDEARRLLILAFLGRELSDGPTESADALPAKLRAHIADAVAARLLPALEAQA
jgi:FeS assembly protein SufD, group 1